jgi:hypothetical protein
MSTALGVIGLLLFSFGAAYVLRDNPDKAAPRRDRDADDGIPLLALLDDVGDDGC